MPCQSSLTFSSQSRPRRVGPLTGNHQEGEPVVLVLVGDMQGYLPENRDALTSVGRQPGIGGSKTGAGVSLPEPLVCDLAHDGESSPRVDLHGGFYPIQSQGYLKGLGPG